MKVSKDDRLRLILSWLGTGSINIFGPPFAGKDTQGKHLARYLGLPIIGGGDILRNTDVPDHIAGYIDRGALIPTNDYIEIVVPYLSKPEFQGKGIVLNSLGRWHGEEKSVVEAAKKSNHDIKSVFFLNIDEKEIWRRWEKQESALGHERGKRHDDDAEALKFRLEEYRNKTLPVIDFYRNKGLLKEINTNRPAEEVFDDMTGYLAGLG